MYSLAATLTAYNCFMFIPICDKIAFAYDIDGVDKIYKIDYLYGIYLFMYIPCCPIAVYIIDHKGMRFALITALVIQVLGYTIRCFA